MLAYRKTSATALIRIHQNPSASIRINQHQSASISINQHQSESISIRLAQFVGSPESRVQNLIVIQKHLWAQDVGSVFRLSSETVWPNFVEVRTGCRKVYICWKRPFVKLANFPNEASCHLTELTWILPRRLPWNPFRRTADVQFRERLKNLNTYLTLLPFCFANS